MLPLKESMKSQTTTLAARFNDIHPSLLLFLNRLRRITIDSRVEDFEQNISRKDYGENLVEITHGDKMDRWLVVKKSLDASKISLQVWDSDKPVPLFFSGGSRNFIFGGWVVILEVSVQRP